MYKSKPFPKLGELEVKNDQFSVELDTVLSLLKLCDCMMYRIKPFPEFKCNLPRKMYVYYSKA